MEQSANPTERAQSKFCIVGAGSSGLAVAKNFRGFWHRVRLPGARGRRGRQLVLRQAAQQRLRSTRLISSKRGTEYTDFPMPGDWPEHPGHELVWQYLRSYARHFDLYSHIEFGEVDRAGSNRRAEFELES